MSALELMSAFVQEDSFSTESTKHHKHGIVKRGANEIRNKTE